MLRLLSALLVLVLAANAAAQDRMLPLRKYELLSAERALNVKRARAQHVLRTFDLSPPLRRTVSQYEQELRAELQRVANFSGDRPYTPSIVHGVDTAQYPSVGAILVNGEARCSGTLIGPKSFLSARHCFHDTSRPDPDPDAYAVYLQNAGILTVTEIQFPKRAELDLALLTLNEPVTGIAPSMVPTVRTSISERRTIVGFGLTATGAADSGIKRHGAITTATCEEEGNSYICWEFDPVSKLANICYSDSGGPVGRAGDSRILYEDGVATGLTPNADCESSPLNWSEAVLMHTEWLDSVVESAEVTESVKLPDCCGKGVDVFVGDGTLPKPDGTRFDEWKFQVAGGVRVLRIALNAVDRSADLKLAVAPTQSPSVTPECRDLGRYKSCEFRFSDPPPANWKARLENVAGGAIWYQLVVTMFEPSGE